MKYLNVILVILSLLACQTQKSNIKNPHIIADRNEKVEEYISIVKKTEKEFINKSFDGIIEDFEHDLICWSNTQGASLVKNQENTRNIGLFKYLVPYSGEEYGAHVRLIVHRRKMNFSKYSGIKFLAKGTPGIMYKIKIFEREYYYQGINIESTNGLIWESSANWSEINQ